jgi:hypothetical protein
MKNIVFILFISAALASCEEKPKTEERNKDLLPTSLVNNPRSAESKPEELAAMPTMDFVDSVYDFGTIKDGDVVSKEFEFKNNGRNPLIISAAKGSCGCTAPEYPSEPIPPGKTGKMKVVFNSAGKEGHQEKSVAITTNSNRGVHMLFIKGNVKK